MARKPVSEAWKKIVRQRSAARFRAIPRNKRKISSYQKRARAEAKLECFKRYGGDPPRCACCGESNVGFLTIDHVNSDGAEHRRQIGIGDGSICLWLKKRNFPNDPPIQVLCCNCNMGRQWNGGVCPHKGIVQTYDEPLPLFDQQDSSR